MRYFIENLGLRNVDLTRFVRVYFKSKGASNYMEDLDYYNYDITTKYELVDYILRYNFSNDNFTVEGVMRVIPRRLDYYGYNYGWGDIETRQRFFFHMLNIRGFMNHLKQQQ